MQPNAKGLLHDMMKVEKEADAVKVREGFEKIYSEKYPKAVECLVKNWSELTSFFHYPAMHWQHIRTTNPIESSFATVNCQSPK